MAAAVHDAAETPWSQRPRSACQLTPEPMPPWVLSAAHAVTRIGILLSADAHGHSVSEAIRAGNLPGCCVAIVVSDVPGAPGIEAARAAGLPTVTIEGQGREQADHEAALDALLRRMRVDLVCLSGYRRTLSNALIRRWPGRILTVHPSLLPPFPAGDAVQQALDSGAQIAGCSVVVVDESLEGGPILFQQTVAVEENDTRASLAARLLTAEREALIKGVRRYTSAAWDLRGRRLVRRGVSNGQRG